MKRKKSVWLVLALVALLVISGCGTTAPPATPAAPASSEAKTLNIGYTGPMSGGAAYYGKDCTDGLDLAVDEIKGLSTFNFGVITHIKEILTKHFGEATNG